MTILTFTSICESDFTEMSFAKADNNLNNITDVGLPSPVNNDDDSDGNYELKNGDIVASDGSPSYSSTVYRIFNLGRKLAIMFSALCLAVSGFRCIIGGEEAFDKERKRMFVFLIVGVTIFAIPYALKIGLMVGRRYGWKPH